ncbi:sigma 54-interacting transcriptional regulator [Psychrobacillus sp. NEAU-3TGS]|uniref:sigma-54 interaction domain-containing protein n=1 Tax=Psychrobacillus sp. NEAU-3TGS TaxID=2995412 RepID=UPI002495F26D|nr:sigma 54-interacting transcriptional regulator [Psychrobacillus sp. NEAU-3TGS]MDI2588332.1 sigma 54-interacting transcriptional regulator [Psychrobacillus sp. NEAU-3TGS]
MSNLSVSLIGSFIRSFVNGIIVLDEQHKILWHDIEGEMPFEVSVGTSISSYFSLDNISFSNNETFPLSLNGKRFSVEVKLFSLETTYIFLCFKEWKTNLVDLEERLYCLERIIDSLDEGVMMSNSEGEIILYNEAQEKMEGLNSQDIIGKHLWSVYNYNPQYSEHRHTFKTGKPIYSRYRAHSTINGVPKYVNYSTFPIQKDGHIISVFSLSTNESKLKDRLHQTIESKRQANVTAQEKVYAKNGTIYTFKDIKGKSHALLNLMREAQNIAIHNTDTLIVGETGTGKELFAQSMHNHSKRADKPFVAINCAAIPENLLESTLFGTVKGAYTGATDQIGLFEYAQDGTLFLDEINSMPMTLQSKLMRVLQERFVRRVGSNEMTSVKCTVISACNEDPELLIIENKMRLDLFYRIAHTSLYIPPLRERTEDVHFFINYFLTYYQTKLSKKVPELSDILQKSLLQYPWPGNIRELEHLIENLIIRVPENAEEIDVDHLPSYMRTKLIPLYAIESSQQSEAIQRPLKKIFNNTEKQLIESTLKLVNWNVSQAAKKLGITRQSLQYHIKKHELEKPTI